MNNSSSANDSPDRLEVLQAVDGRGDWRTVIMYPVVYAMWREVAVLGYSLEV